MGSWLCVVCCWLWLVGCGQLVVGSVLCVVGSWLWLVGCG